jgi:hypothetical protein
LKGLTGVIGGAEPPQQPRHLLKVPGAGEQLCRDAIEAFLPREAVERYEPKVARWRKQLRRFLPEEMKRAAADLRTGRK